MKSKEQLEAIYNRFQYPHPCSEDLDNLYISGECTMEEVEAIAHMAGFTTSTDIERLKNKKVSSRAFILKQANASIPNGIYRNADIRDMLGGIKAFANIVCSFGNEYKSKGLLIIGSDGTSKTYSACAVANQVLRKTNRTVKYVEFSEFFTSMENIKTSAEYIHQLIKPDLLIIDNVMLYSLSDYKLTHFLSLIRTRGATTRHTIITTNLGMTDFYAYLSEKASKDLADATIKTIDKYDIANVKEFRGVA